MENNNNNIDRNEWEKKEAAHPWSMERLQLVQHCGEKVEVDKFIYKALLWIKIKINKEKLRIN